jgi:xylulokinase
VGISATHTRAHVVRAILEGVAFSLRDTLTIFAELKIPLESIRLGGGGARGSLWRQIQADVYGMPVAALDVEEGPAYGAALLAGVGVGNWTSVENAADATVHISERIEPEAPKVALMNRRYDAYRKLYPALRDVWRERL